MPRHPRLVVPGIALHIVQRGVDRQACFFTDVDRHFYLATLETDAATLGCAIHAYVLMTNHVHLLLTPGNAEAPGRLLQAVGRRYVRYVNDSYGRTGTLWEGRFKSCLVGEENYLLSCHRYIEMNPVRAGMVEQPADYRWSSHRANAGLAESSLLTPHPALDALGADRAQRTRAYRAMFEPEETPSAIDAIRRTTQGNYVLGSQRFAAEIAALLGRRTSPGRRGRPASPKPAMDRADGGAG